MYQGIKSKISTNDGKTVYFTAISEYDRAKASPQYYLRYLNDLEKYLSARQIIRYRMWCLNYEYCKTWQLNVNIKKQNTKIVESKDSGKHEIYP